KLEDNLEFLVAKIIWASTTRDGRNTPFGAEVVDPLVSQISTHLLFSLVFALGAPISTRDFIRRRFKLVFFFAIPEHFLITSSTRFPSTLGVFQGPIWRSLQGRGGVFEAIVALIVFAQIVSSAVRTPLVLVSCDEVRT